MIQANKYYFLISALSACTASNGDNWPSVSFGDDIATIENSIATSSDVALAPLPSLTVEERLGLENPEGYFSSIRQTFLAVNAQIKDRRTDYQMAKTLFTSSTGKIAPEHWLTAQMELSNISQATEAIKTLRAQLALVSNLVPSAAEYIFMVEAVELSNREFLFNERIFLAQNKP